MNVRRPIFIVEDSDNDFELLQRLLAGSVGPVAIERAVSGNAAIERLAKASLEDAPSLMLTDLSMPDGDGFDLLAWVKRQPAMVETVLVVLSATRRGADIDRAYALGAHFFLSKFPTVEMIGRLCAAAERRDLALQARIAALSAETQVPA